MKRSLKLRGWAAQERGLALMIFAVSGCVGIWSARVFLSTWAGGLGVFILALAGLFLAALHWREYRRLHWLACAEEVYESQMNRRL